MPPTIALLTDFGTTDTYVGIMKAVMQRIAPDARFIDITHGIQPQNVRQGAFTLLNAFTYFGPGTIFLVVVDPGVGGTRKPIAASAGGYYFVAPDNGVLSYMLADFENPEVVELSNLSYQLTPVSNTFHGRDIFAPTAAHLASGVPLYKFGPTVEHVYKQLLPQLKIEGSQIIGQALYTDHFGNIITSIGKFNWTDEHTLRLTPQFGNKDRAVNVPAEKVSIKIRNTTIAQIRRTYGEVDRNELLTLIGSSGYLEIALNQGSAASQLNLTSGDQVTLQIG